MTYKPFTKDDLLEIIFIWRHMDDFAANPLIAYCDVLKVPSVCWMSVSWH